MKQHTLFGETSKSDADNESTVSLPSHNLPSIVPSETGRCKFDLSFTIETAGKDLTSDSIVGIALCKQKGTAYYVPIRHSQGLNLPDALNVVKPYLEDTSVSKVGHNLKHDILMLRKEGVHVQGIIYDTMIGSYLLNANKPDHSLENVALEYLLYKKRSYPEIIGPYHSFADVPIDEATLYTAEDAELAMELKELLFKKLRDEGLEALYFNMEMPLVYVLADMEAAGIKIQRDRIAQLSRELDGELVMLRQKIFMLSGEEFNINSPKQLSKILFENLGLKPLKKTKTGYSTGMDILEELAKSHDLPGEILNYRTLFKLKTTYIDTLPVHVNKKTGRLHTSFNQTVTATGRLSSSEPNVQNIPIRGPWGTKIREAFIAEEGHILLSADYSQVELRILAHMSNDSGLIEAFRTNIDIHTRTAAELYGISKEAVTQQMRRTAKTVNFGVIYGMSPYGLSDTLKISPKEASLFIGEYFKKHRSVQTYIEETLMSARTNGYVTTMLGRKRLIPEINSSNALIRQQAERMAINSPIQGTAADLIKIAMISIWRSLKEKDLKTRLILQIHDELLLEVPENELKEVKSLIKFQMENAISLSVPIKVEIGCGKSWAEAH
ncbi:MAG: DNA polymerase I [Dissulfurispiraceae bacterium]